SYLSCLCSSPTETCTLSLHDALPISRIVAERESRGGPDEDILGRMLHVPVDDEGHLLDAANVRHQVLTLLVAGHETTSGALSFRSEEHTSELQSRFDLVCRLLLEKKK